jgi:hypothetical protein
MRLESLLNRVVNPVAARNDGEAGLNTGDRRTHADAGLSDDEDRDSTPNANSDVVQEPNSEEARQCLEFAESCMDYYGVEGGMRDDVRRFAKVSAYYNTSSQTHVF